jgi:hypothetical protein
MAKYVTLQVANMRKPQEFILYPYDGGDTINLQSDKRFAQVNLRTGKGIINRQNKDYANSITLMMTPVPFELPEAVKTEIQGYLWRNNGKDGNIGGVIHYENKELFSEPK